MERSSLLLNLLVNQRVKSLVDDGFVLRFSSILVDGTRFFSLVHHNGNRVQISASVERDHMTQRSNSQVVYDGRITA